MAERRRGVSRRDLLGLFGKSARGFADGLSGTGTPSPARSGPGTPAEYPAFDRVLRPPQDTVTAAGAGPGRFELVIADRHLLPGRSVRVHGPEMIEPVILVRVHAAHLAACGGECPVDGSDLAWSPEEDRLLCHGCGSRWRLDGEVTRGPADSPLARFVVDRDGEKVTLTQS